LNLGPFCQQRRFLKDKEGADAQSYQERNYRREDQPVPGAGVLGHDRGIGDGLTSSIDELAPFQRLAAIDELAPFYRRCGSQPLAAIRFLTAVEGSRALSGSTVGSDLRHDWQCRPALRTERYTSIVLVSAILADHLMAFRAALTSSKLWKVELLIDSWSDWSYGSLAPRDSVVTVPAASRLQTISPRRPDHSVLMGTLRA
jgi:hypothetical protein